MSAKPPEQEIDGELSGQMSFLDHLEELRTRIFRALIAIAVAFVVCWIFVQDIYVVVSQPILEALEASGSSMESMIFTRPQQPFSLFLRVAFLGALFLSSPFLLAQVWMFIAPGLYRHERRYAIPFVMSGTVLGALGALFGYYIAFPFALEFLINWGERAGLQAMIDATEYFSLFLTIELALAVIFQIPPVIFVLSRMGLVNPGFLFRNTKYAVLISFILAAIITPTPDIANMMIIAGPMILLYMVGVLVAFVFGKKRRKPDE